MIYKVIFHISTLYIYTKFHQSKHYLHISIPLYTRNFLHENGKQILHNGNRSLPTPGGLMADVPWLDRSLDSC